MQTNASDRGYEMKPIICLTCGIRPIFHDYYCEPCLRIWNMKVINRGLRAVDAKVERCTQCGDWRYIDSDCFTCLKGKKHKKR